MYIKSYQHNRGMFGFIIGVVVLSPYYPVWGQTDCNPPNCDKVTITTSRFTSVDNNNYTTTGQAFWVTDGVTKGQRASISSLYPAWEAGFGQARTVSRINIFWEDEQDDVYVSVGGRICHSAVSTESTYRWTQQYTLICDVPVRGNSLLIYREPTVQWLTLSLCEVEIYATSESSSTPPVSTTTPGPTTPSRTASSHGDVTVPPTLTITLDRAITTIAPTPTTPSSAYVFTNPTNPTTTMSLPNVTTISSPGPTTPATAATSHGDATDGVLPTLTITLDSAITTIAPTPTTPSSAYVFTNPTNPTTTMSLPTVTTLSSMPTTLPSAHESTGPTNPTTTFSRTNVTASSSTPSSTDMPTSDATPSSVDVLDTTTTTSYLYTSTPEKNTPVLSNYENTQTEATRFSYFTTSEKRHESTSNHFLAPSSTVYRDTASTSAMISNPTTRYAYFTWPTSSLFPSQGSSSVFRPATVSLRSLTISEASTKESMSPLTTYNLTATTSLTATSVTTTTVNSASETNVPATSVTSTPASTKTTFTTKLTSTGDTLTPTATPGVAATTPNVGQGSNSEKSKTSNMNLIVIVAAIGGCVMLLYIAGIILFVWRQHRKARYSPGRAK